MFNCFLEEHQLQFASTFQVVLIHLAFKILNDLLEVVDVLIHSFSRLKTQNFRKMNTFDLLGVDTLRISLADLRTVVQEPIPILAVS